MISQSWRSGRQSCWKRSKHDTVFYSIYSYWQRPFRTRSQSWRSGRQSCWKQKRISRSSWPKWRNLYWRYGWGRDCNGKRQDLNSFMCHSLRSSYCIDPLSLVLGWILWQWWLCYYNYDRTSVTLPCKTKATSLWCYEITSTFHQEVSA